MPRCRTVVGSDEGAAEGLRQGARREEGLDWLTESSSLKKTGESEPVLSGKTTVRTERALGASKCKNASSAKVMATRRPGSMAEFSVSCCRPLSVARATAPLTPVTLKGSPQPSVVDGVGLKAESGRTNSLNPARTSAASAEPDGAPSRYTGPSEYRPLTLRSNWVSRLTWRATSPEKPLAASPAKSTEDGGATMTRCSALVREFASARRHESPELLRSDRLNGR